MRSVAMALASLVIWSTGVHAQAPQFHPIRESVTREAHRLAQTRPAAVTHQQPPAARHRNWFARHPVLTGTMAGAGVGLAFAAAEGCDSSDYSCGGIVGFLVGTGAALGAVGGLVAAVFLH